jgi:hypothetical protein
VPRAVAALGPAISALLNFLGDALHPAIDDIRHFGSGLQLRMGHGRTGILILNLPLTKYRYAAAVV